jgi:hypothetical protein
MRKRLKKKRWCTRVASCLNYLTDGINLQAVSFYTYFHLREIPYNVLRALCTGVLSIFVFVPFRLIILCSLFVSFLSDCFPDFCGIASPSNFYSILSSLVKTEVYLQSVPPTPFSKHLQTPHIHSVLSPVFWRYCWTFPNITNLQTWTKNSVWTYLNVFWHLYVYGGLYNRTAM